MNTAENNWHVLYVASRAEKKVAKRFGENGISYYLPLVKQIRNWSDRKKWVELPLFTGYIFVNIQPSQFNAVLSTPGIVNFVKHDGKVAVVPEREMAALQSVVKLGYDITLINPRSFESGEPVEIAYGPLKGMCGQVIEEEKQDLVHIYISCIKNGLQIHLPKGCLKSLAIA